MIPLWYVQSLMALERLDWRLNLRWTQVHGVLHGIIGDIEGAGWNPAGDDKSVRRLVWVSGCITRG
jgi:hypothetical protein